MDVDPYICTRTYYAFVAGLISFILVFSMGTAGYIGSVSMAFASAAAMYPIHKRVRTHLKIVDSTIPSSKKVDQKLAVEEIWRGLYDWSMPNFRYWYLVLSTMILIFAVIFVFRVVVRFAWL
jgi:hypothetical protein